MNRFLRFKLLFALDSGGVEGGSDDTGNIDSADSAVSDSTVEDTKGTVEDTTKTTEPKKDTGDITDFVKSDVSYYDQLSDDNKKLDLSDVKDLDSLVSKYNEQKTSAKDAIKVPSKGSSKEEVRDFLTKMGVPEGSESYEIDKGKLTDAEFNVLSKTFKENAFKSALSAKQAENMWSMVKGHFEASRSAVEKTNQGLKDNLEDRLDKEFKESFPDKAERNEEIVKSATLFNKFTLDNDLGKFFEPLGLNLNPAFIKAIANIQKNSNGSYVNNSMGKNEKTGANGNMYGDAFNKSIRS